MIRHHVIAEITWPICQTSWRYWTIIPAPPDNSHHHVNHDDWANKQENSEILHRYTLLQGYVRVGYSPPYNYELLEVPDYKSTSHLHYNNVTHRLVLYGYLAWHIVTWSTWNWKVKLTSDGAAQLNSRMLFSISFTPKCWEIPNLHTCCSQCLSGKNFAIASYSIINILK